MKWIVCYRESAAPPCGRNVTFVRTVAIVWVGSAVVLMRGTTRETGYSILVMVDITERKHAQQKLDELLALEQAERRDAEQARAEAEAANRAKDHFLAMISHELRSPLQGIVGRVEIIRHGVDRPQLEQALEAIDRAVARQAKLVKDLLDISSIVSGKIQIEHRLVSPGPNCRACTPGRHANGSTKAPGT